MLDFRCISSLSTGLSSAPQSERFNYFCQAYGWEHLTAEDEKVVVNKLLAYHPCSEGKLDVGFIPLR